MNFILHYDGAKFDPDGTFQIPKEAQPKSKTDALAQKFSNIGALVLRYHLGQGQRAGLIQQVARPDYDENPVEAPAKGNDQNDLFSRNPTLPAECKALAHLEKCCHATLGRGKVLNERAQPLVHTNKTELCGEQHLWDLIHSTVWTCGINFAFQLNNQGFTYVNCPNNLTSEEYNEIQELLEKGDFTIEGDSIHVKGRILKTSNTTQLQLDFDPEMKTTFRANKILISTPECEQKAPLGWMVHKEKKQAVKSDFLEDMVRIIRISKGGFYELTKNEQSIIQAGRLKNTDGTGLFTNNQAFNAIYAISGVLERDFGFDPEKLMGNSLSIAYKRASEFLKGPENLEDFLTGPLLTEMVQSLQVSREESNRKKLPLRFTNHFPVLDNNVKAIAYAFGITDSLGKPVFIQDDSTPFTKDQTMLDVVLNGKLALPSLIYGKHAAAILSTAMLVAEEMLVEQLFKEAVEQGTVEQLLTEILNDEASAKYLAPTVTHATKALGNEKLGLQYPESEPLVKFLREKFGFQPLFDLVECLSEKDISIQQALYNYSDLKSREELLNSLRILYRIGNIIQKNPRTTAQKENSRGIQAGLIPLIVKIAPELKDELGLSLEGAVHASIVDPIMNEPVIKAEYSENIMCSIQYLGVMVLTALIAKVIFKI